ncbi:PQQ-dependent sugar dehydrogenase [Pseudooctadecabacter jejudonensis]|uniref:Soluble aldose sugar dehydrogenase YliI n=1 Tax=Pseudooctadecabacter jejudonensis TaxID=1391910 RepID=A0A1Y5S8U7_9RHOB|nr:PQQ-dependent sugar dehydrogenase [Pseudooctadecabacter jejudonensis]SLN34424.1 Soluble aldose sugar dehydrogenase YliI precursor [Pseudooctadecabacter jejudonensis]
MMWRYVMCFLPVMAAAEVEQGPKNADFVPAFDGQTRAAELPTTDLDVSVFASGLDFPWGIAPLPEGGFLVSERGGALQRVDADGRLIGAVSGLPEIEAIRQGGLLDVAVSPEFATDGLVYWTYSKPVRGGVALAAARGRLDGDALVEVEDIFVQAPATSAGQHFGSRIIPVDGGVWITTGDRGTPDLAQGNNTVGKVLWYDGADVSVWSTGHRNIQGAILRDGTLWTVEHGPRGGDELNRPEQGLNYGWPIISYGINYNGRDITGGEAVADGLEQPVYYWDPVIAPGGMGAYPSDADFVPWRGDLLVSSLRPGGVMRLQIDAGRVVGEERLLADVGRVRDVEVLANGDLLVLIDAPDADILRVRPVGGAGG